MVEVCKIMNGLEKEKKEICHFSYYKWIGSQVKQYGELLNKQKDGMSFPHKLWSSVTRDVMEARSMNGLKMGFDNLVKENSTQHRSGFWG